MTDWIKYDGTNKPDDALVRVRFPDGWVSGDDAWLRSDTWRWDIGVSQDHISHFQLNDKEMTDLEDGFYWVRLVPGSSWEVALIDTKLRIARFSGNLNYWDLREIEIDPSRIVREG